MVFSRSVLASVLSISFSLFTFIAPATGQGFTIEQLPTLPGALYSLPQDINDNGVIAGSIQVKTPVEVTGISHAVIWNEKGAKDVLGDDFFGATASKIDQFNSIVGSGALKFGYTFFRYSYGGSGGMGDHYFAMNDLGTVVLVNDVLGGIFFNIYDSFAANGDAPPGVVAINNLNVMVGNDTISTDAYQARGQFIFKNGQFSPLPGVPRALNDAEDVVGNAENKAFLYSDGKFTDLHPQGFATSDALDINQRKEVVGFAEVGGQKRAFLWRNGEAINLNALIPAGAGWTLHVAQAINNLGHIVGDGTVGGKRQGFLLKLGSELPQITKYRCWMLRNRRTCAFLPTGYGLKCKVVKGERSCEIVKK